MSFARQVVPGRVYLVTRRCTQRQFLLRPDGETNNAFIYCLAYTARRNGIQVVAFIANSNHYHAVVIDKEGKIPRFLEEFHRLVAKHQNALRGRWENLWSTEQTSLVELVGDDDVIAKTLYTLTNPVKDHLVERARHWPGATSLAATLNGTVLSARRPTRFFSAEGDMPAKVRLRCVQPPGMKDLPRQEYGRQLRAAIAGIEKAAADERRARGFRVLGREAILAQSPTDCPGSREPRRQIDPQIAARDKGPRLEAIARLKEFRVAYAERRSGWLEGEPGEFPLGTWWLRIHAGVRCVGAPRPG